MKTKLLLLVALVAVSCGTGRLKNPANPTADFSKDTEDCHALAAARHAQDDLSRVAGGTAGISTAIKIDYDQCMKDRGYKSPSMMDSVTGGSTRSPAPAQTPSPSPGAGSRMPQLTTTVVIESQPGDGEVYVDGQFIGTAPVTLRLTEGSHAIVVNHAGFESWKRDLMVGDSPAHVVASLQTK